MRRTTTIAGSLGAAAILILGLFYSCLTDDEEEPSEGIQDGAEDPMEQRHPLIMTLDRSPRTTEAALAKSTYWHPNQVSVFWALKSQSVELPPI